MDEQGKYDLFLQIAKEFGARPKRNQLLNEIEMVHRITEWQLMANGEDKNNDSAGDGVTSHIVVEGIPMQ